MPLSQTESAKDSGHYPTQRRDAMQVRQNEEHAERFSPDLRARLRELWRFGPEGSGWKHLTRAADSCDGREAGFDV